MEVGKAPRNSEGRTLGLKRSVHHYQYDADRISKTPLGPKQSYATHTDLGMQFAAAWKKYESYGDNELSDKYVTKAIDFENARAWQIGLEGGSYTNQDHLVRVSPKKYLEDLCPDTYCSIHYMAHDPNEDHRKVVKLNDGTLVYRHEHTKFHPAAGEWILIDIDHLDLRSHSPVTAEGKEIEAKMIEGFKAALSGHYASRMFSGRGNVVETSKTGMQITLQLSAPMTTAETLHAFYADPAIKAAVMSLGEEMRKVIERGGNVDPAVHNVGRLCRLPGSRIDKQGNYFISRLVAIF
jgi:hypothetical protein